MGTDKPGDLLGFGFPNWDNSKNRNTLGADLARQGTAENSPRTAMTLLTKKSPSTMITVMASRWHQSIRPISSHHLPSTSAGFPHLLGAPKDNLGLVGRWHWIFLGKRKERRATAEMVSMVTHFLMPRPWPQFPSPICPKPKRKRENSHPVTVPNWLLLTKKFQRDLSDH